MTFRVVKLRYVIISITATSLVIFMPIIGIVEGMWLYASVSAILWLCVLGAAIEYFIIRRIVITAQGVEYKSLMRHYEFGWDNIKTISIEYYPMRGEGRPAWICFSTKEYPNHIPYEEKEVHKKPIVAHFRPKLINEVKKYWKQDIYGLNF